MPATYRRNALGRIGLVINAYKPQRPQNPDLTTGDEGLNGYLELHLVIHDWLFRQQLPHDEQFFLIHTLAVEQVELMVSKSYKRLFHQYKRAGVEWLERWKQAQGELSLDQ